MRKDGFDPAEPIEVVNVDGRLIIHDGHHRARAAGAANISEVPIRIIDASEEMANRYLQQALEAAENLGLMGRW